MEEEHGRIFGSVLHGVVVDASRIAELPAENSGEFVVVWLIPPLRELFIERGHGQFEAENCPNDYRPWLGLTAEAELSSSMLSNERPTLSSGRSGRQIPRSASSRAGSDERDTCSEA